jgi:predicted ATP-binding protein involved in virulence
LRIEKVQVERLFGIFDHEIPMKMEDRVTIIHGPNGFGKTTILKMVDGLFNARYSELRSIPFREFRVELEDGRSVVVTKAVPDTSRPLPGVEGRRKRGRDRHLVVRLVRGNKDIERTELASPASADWESVQYHMPLEQFVPGLVREGRTTWRYVPTHEELDLEEVVERFSDQLPLPSPRPEKKNGEWLREIQKAVQVRLIESERLRRIAKLPRRAREYEGPPALELSVAVHSGDLAKAIQNKLAEYAAVSQSLDRTFPVRLVEKMQSRPGEHQLASPDLRSKLNQLEAKRARLQEAGLLDKQQDPRFQVPEELQETQRVLTVYVRDVEQKLSVFDDIATRIDLLKEIVNSRFSFKHISIDKEKGFIFNTQEGQPLSPTHLSSGEQHMLVLFSELLFRVEPNSLVMIDEPEISLHVTWQQQFLRDVQRVTELASFDVLIATHSPQIIHDRWDDLTVELRSPMEQGV